ncbi:chorismate mutase 2-like [Gastrolobium bilobum]|uniref:chorismate mutase 2-like n=1 Tax=Gastrolobium bilobum TaxID=150636 RepID=UPI002AB21A71|nr:chorismate mutase 2-like [Gastrolobium bilobum]
MLRFVVPLLALLSCTERYRTAKAESGNEYTLDSVRESLARQEDTMVFGLIDRVRFPFNSPTYHQNYSSFPEFRGSLLEFLVHNTETIQAKAGRYINPEENPFFPENLPRSVVPHYNFSQFLHPVAALININKPIWKMYFHKLLPMFVASGDDGNYAQTAASDLSLLQAISRRIHYGKFVAEAKFRDSPQDYEPLIRAQDRKALMKLLTSESVEEMVRMRVEKKAMVFGQEVSLNGDVKRKYKVDPSLVSCLYKKWIIPLTKIVQVEYLLLRLD